jgi:hypothetical protein
MPSESLLSLVGTATFVLVVDYIIVVNFCVQIFKQFVFNLFGKLLLDSLLVTFGQIAITL